MQGWLLHRLPRHPLSVLCSLSPGGPATGRGFHPSPCGLRADPGKVRGESLRYRPGAWMVLVEMAGESTGWVIWVSPNPTRSTLCGSARNPILTRGPAPRKRHDLSPSRPLSQAALNTGDPRVGVRPSWSSSAQTFSHRRGAQAVSNLDRPTAYGDPASSRGPADIPRGDRLLPAPAHAAQVRGPTASPHQCKPSA
jgi:hypothetical protein